LSEAKKFLSAILSFFFALKVKMQVFKFEFYQIRLELNHK